MVVTFDHVAETACGDAVSGTEVNRCEETHTGCLCASSVHYDLAFLSRALLQSYNSLGQLPRSLPGSLRAAGGGRRCALGFRIG